MAEQAKKGKKRTSFLTMLVIAILIALVGVQLIHLRSQIDDARSQLTALQSDLDAAKQENDALASALEKADDPEFLQELARDQLGIGLDGIVQGDFFAGVGEFHSVGSFRW